MTKIEFFDHVRALYRAANTADSDSPTGDWMHPSMAGDAGCAALDKMLHAMVSCGVITAQDLQCFHDTL